jgi:hypothetical protein
LQLAATGFSGERVSNTWITYPATRDNTPKGVLIPDSKQFRMEQLEKEQSDAG